jgi:hypothetical protein
MIVRQGMYNWRSPSPLTPAVSLPHIDGLITSQAYTATPQWVVTSLEGSRIRLNEQHILRS